MYKPPSMVNYNIVNCFVNLDVGLRRLFSFNTFGLIGLISTQLRPTKDGSKNYTLRNRKTEGIIFLDPIL